jgi:hypothetical protein
MVPTMRATAGTMIVLATLALPAYPQSSAPPNLSGNQRLALQAIVRAAASAGGIEDVPEHKWPFHVLRLSDGSHYVAFTIDTPPVTSAKRALVLYVRLATRHGTSAPSPDERSGVAEWLAGQTPGPPASKRGIDFGEMPTFGAGAIAARGPGPQSLQLLELQRKRAQEHREAEERERKAKLEGEAASRTPRPFLPFEDFDVRALPFSHTADVMAFRRSLTAGPGDYDLILGVADPEAKDPAASVRLFRRRLVLPPASLSEFALSSVILADGVRLRETLLPPNEQSSAPYTIGMLEITPAADRLFTNDENVTLVVQVINASASATTGKPDVALSFRVFKRNGDREEPIGTLTPHIYNNLTLPPDFEVSKRHPLFDAVSIPLRTFKRGEYRVEIAANDRAAGIGTITDATFAIAATPAALLREAPPLAAPFQRTDLLQPQVLGDLLAHLSGPQPSAAFTQAVAAARAGRFADLIRDEPVLPTETDARQVLRTLAMYAIGDNPASLSSALQQALQRKVAPAAVHTLLGAVRALEGNDNSAVAAWDTAIAAGASGPALAPLVADALLRLGDAARAAASVERLSNSGDAALVRRLAAARVAQGRYDDAMRALEPILTRHPSDVDAQWIALHSWFAAFVNGQARGSDAAATRARIRELANGYIAAKGPNAALAAEWRDAMK